MAHCYYVDALEGAVGERVRLGPEDARHAATVSRARVGETVLVGDGRGTLATARFVEVRPEVVLEVSDVRRERVPSPRIGLAQALAKGDRDELAIQAATELGVDLVVPWQASRSIVTWKGERGAKALARWRTIVREAGKQSLRAHVPEVAEPVGTAQLAALGDRMRLVVLDPTAEASLASVEPDGRDLLLVVGPEGGIAPDELERLGGERVAMGPHVVRTSTAGPAAIAALAARWRW
ncbi:16S rRNA (uracil(1498)-N(3))-methyltransferase [Agrococcus sp. SGAir0287]|uniref:16S rRNA (uracil(1498)-N(3))-methyltransferase n=1 Tax=Agrococcus sp. SGAir0287 TaxID=2070347 RepID=UPI0010CCF5B7|nr:16S rRNA (uracil(1498)-N(3))-methyltransferase [Agrococcus sp. SGAir0287]QCR19452.1 16S rRNA (uracil(1498)-N(3))-methyltransferase [Agrococcus sp. SGAir0287]